jgi:paraquat-inducible protein A
MRYVHEGDRAYCSRCNHFLTRKLADGIERTLAYTMAASVFLILACAYPFLAFKSSGIESVMTLPQTAWALYMNGMPDLALLVAAFIILIPAVILLFVLAIYIPIACSYAAPWLTMTAKMLFTLQNWSMVEVFLIGVIVSLVKVAGMATVILGISFWAYAAFSVCLTMALAHLDRYQCWLAIDEVKPG